MQSGWSTPPEGTTQFQTLENLANFTEDISKCGTKKRILACPGIRVVLLKIYVLPTYEHKVQLIKEMRSREYFILKMKDNRLFFADANDPLEGNVDEIRDASM